MNITQIVKQLRAERSRLDAAVRALEGVSDGNSAPGRRRGRPPGNTNKPAGGVSKGRRRMSAATRKRISEAMRKRWAAVKAGKK